MPKASFSSRLSLLHATRGRPAQARACRQKWLDAAAMPARVEHIFAIDCDDADSIQQLADLKPRVVERAGGGCVAAWNLAALASSGDILIQLSDDWSPVQNWDEKFVKRLRDVSQPGVLRVSDGRRSDDLLCMAICTRAWMEEQGELLHSGYISLYSDDEFSFRAYQNGVVIDARDIVLLHNHPNYDSTVPTDETYSQQNSEDRKKKGHETFLQRNPTAVGHWLHEGIWDRHFVPRGMGSLGDRFVSAVLKEQCMRLERSIAQLTTDCDKFRMENNLLFIDNDRLAFELRRVLESAEAWQRRSWVKRAFHRWRPPGSNPKK